MVRQHSDRHACIGVISSRTDVVQKCLDGFDSRPRLQVTNLRASVEACFVSTCPAYIK